MKITEMALRASRLTYLAAVIILVAGIATFLNFPSQEEPSVTIRDAVVAVLNPGMPAERVEQLIARPIEERLRELAEVVVDKWPQRTLWKQRLSIGNLRANALPYGG